MDQDDDGKRVPRIVGLSREAIKQFETWWKEDGERSNVHGSGMFKSHLGKYPGMVARLALDIEYLWWSVTDEPEPCEISEAAVLQAICLIEEYFRPMAVRAFGEAALPPEERGATQIAKRIVKDRLMQVNASEIRRKWRIPGLRSALSVEAALGVLVDARWIGRPPGQMTVGRPKSDYAVNPLLWEQYDEQMA